MFVFQHNIALAHNALIIYSIFEQALLLFWYDNWFFVINRYKHLLNIKRLFEEVNVPVKAASTQRNARVSFLTVKYVNIVCRIMQEVCLSLRLSVRFWGPWGNQREPPPSTGEIWHVDWQPEVACLTDSQRINPVGKSEYIHTIQRSLNTFILGVPELDVKPIRGYCIATKLSWKKNRKKTIPYLAKLFLILFYFQ